MVDISQFLSVLEDPYAKARKERQKGRRVVGVTPMHFPEELIHATGALPIILQESNEPVTLGFGHIYAFYCGFTRSNVDLAIKGKLDFFDAMVVSDMCLQIKHMSHIIRRHIPIPFIYVQWPLEANVNRWLPYTVERLKRCQQRLERELGVKIAEEAIGSSIAVYNRSRALLKRLYEIRRQKPGIIRAKETMGIVMSSMLWGKEEHNKFLEELIPQLEKREPPSDGRVKLWVSGHLCQAVKADILDLIENVGGVVVGDDLWTGYRYFATETPTQPSPLEALARRYLDLTFPCPTRTDPAKDWGRFLMDMVRGAGAQGIVVLVVKHCEAHMLYYPWLKDVLLASDIPHILIETEHEIVSLEGVRTRLQAFVEMLKR